MKTNNQLLYHVLTCTWMSKESLAQSIRKLCFHWLRVSKHKWTMLSLAQLNMVGRHQVSKKRVSHQRTPEMRRWGPLGNLGLTLWGVTSLAWWNSRVGHWIWELFRELYNSCYSLMNWIQQVRILKYLFCLVSTCEETESQDGTVQMGVPTLIFAHFNQVV